MKMNFILPHSFELDLLGVPLLSTLELILFGHSNIFVRAKAFFIGITSSGSIWIAMGSYTRQTVLFSRDGCSRLALVFVFLYGGYIPFVESLCFASQRTPTVCPNCAGSISTIGLAPFCFKSAGLALIWASAVLLWFLALLYSKRGRLSIRRLYNNCPLLLHQKSKKLGYMKLDQNFRVVCARSWAWSPPCCSRNPASARGCIPSAAIFPWPCAGRCSTAARCLVLFSACCSAAVRRSEPGTVLTSQPCFPYKFDIPAIQTVNNVPILPHFTRIRRSKN